MAGVSNTTFLTPSHFTQSTAKTSDEKHKTNVLIPPSSYKGSVQCVTEKKGRELSVEAGKVFDENVKLKHRLEKLLAENMLLSKDQNDYGVKSKAVVMEVDALRRKIGDLEQEREILLYEIQEKETLSEMIVKLRNDLRKSKEKMIIKDEQVSGQIQGYCDVIKKLKNNLKINEKSFLKEKECCEKLYLKLRDLEEKYNTLKSNYELEKGKLMNEVTQKENERKVITEKWEEEMKKIGETNKKLENKIKCLEKLNEDSKQEKIVILNEKVEIENKNQEMKNGILKEKETFQNEWILINNKVEELQCIVSEKNNEISGMNRITENMKEENEIEIEKLQKVIGMKESEMKQEQQLFQETLEIKETEMKKVLKTVEQLRSYIGEVKPRKDDQLSNENKELKNIMKVLTDENTTLHSTVKLLNIRLSSILEIMTMQENELTGVNRDNKGYEGVLRKWREKVFELMIQLRSYKIVGKNERNQEKIKIENLKKVNATLEKDCYVLEHKLKDKTAALEVEINSKEFNEKRLKSLSKEMDVLKSDQQRMIKQFEDIKSDVKTLEGMLSPFLTSYSKYCNKMDSFGERINFAACRVQFITGYLTHRAADLQQSSEQSLDKCEISRNDNDENHLKEEVEKLQKERTLLLKETKKNNDILTEKTSEITKYFENIIKQKDDLIHKLEDSAFEMKTRLNVLQENYEKKSEEFDDVSEHIEELKLTVNKQKMTLEKEYSTMIETQRLEHVEETRVLEQQLNDIRREQTKTIVSLKDALKQVKREKEQASQMIANIEQEYTEKLEKCQRKLMNVEKERNCLMMKIKQERLPSLKGDTKQPMARKQAESDEDTQEQQAVNMDNFETSEALIALQELQILSKQIVEMQELKQNK